MKLLQYSFYAAIATLLMAADCSNKDSEFYNDVFVVGPKNLVTVTLISPLTGAYHISTSNFSRFVSEVGQTNPLDVYKSSGAARFTFSFLIEKENSNNEWELVTPSVVTEKGNVEVKDFVVAHAVYNSATQQYDFEADVQTNQSGNFRLSFGYDGSPSTTIILRSESVNNNLFVNLYSVCDQLDDSGHIYFSVGQ